MGGDYYIVRKYLGGVGLRFISHYQSNVRVMKDYCHVNSFTCEHSNMMAMYLTFTVGKAF